jgi:hypothetical protein
MCGHFGDRHEHHSHGHSHNHSRRISSSAAPITDEQITSKLDAVIAELQNAKSAIGSVTDADERAMFLEAANQLHIASEQVNVGIQIAARKTPPSDQPTA